MLVTPNRFVVKFVQFLWGMTPLGIHLLSLNERAHNLGHVFFFFIFVSPPKVGLCKKWFGYSHRKFFFVFFLAWRENWKARPALVWIGEFLSEIIFLSAPFYIFFFWPIRKGEGNNWKKNPPKVLPCFFFSVFQLMVNCWFGSFGGLDSDWIPENERDWDSWVFFPTRIPNH